MLLSSNFLLNMTEKKNEYEMYPFVHCFSNLQTEDQAFKKILVPDVCPSKREPFDISVGEVMSSDKEYDLSMVSGEFIEIYSRQQGKPSFHLTRITTEEWNCVVTCYFIDTAHNVIDYMQTIYKILKKGGAWINFGPLLWHYAEQLDQVQIELPLDEVKSLAKKVGFDIVRDEMRESTYTHDQESMLHYKYNCSFFTAIKRWNNLSNMLQ